VGIWSTEEIKIHSISPLTIIRQTQALEESLNSQGKEIIKYPNRSIVKPFAGKKKGQTYSFQCVEVMTPFKMSFALMLHLRNYQLLYQENLYSEMK